MRTWMTFNGLVLVSEGAMTGSNWKISISAEQTNRVNKKCQQKISNSNSDHAYIVLFTLAAA